MAIPLSPRASNGAPIILNNAFPGEVVLNFTGCADSSTTRFAGPLFGLQKAGIGDAVQEFSFLDGVFLAGGHVEWEGGAWDSYLYFEVIAPATTTKAPVVAGQGNCNKVATGYGFNIIVPAAGDGEFDIDAPIPVPANDDETDAFNGYWNYSDPWLGKGTISAGTPQASKYNLFDASLDLAHFCKLHIARATGTRDLIAPAIKPKWILPEWVLKVLIHNADSASTLKVVWDLLIARRRTV